MTVATFNPNTGGAGTCMNNNASWATCRGASTSSQGTTSDLQVISVAGFYNRRIHLPFDTSSLPDGAIINSWSLTVRRDDAIIVFGNAGSASIHVVPSTEVSSTAIASDDYDNFTNTSKGSFALASTSNGADFTINGSDTSLISVTGYTQLALITSLDLNNTTPSGTDAQIGLAASGGANKPVLTVDYSLPASFLMMF